MVAASDATQIQGKAAQSILPFNLSPEVIRLVVMMYLRIPLSLRNGEDLLA